MELGPGVRLAAGVAEAPGDPPGLALGTEDGATLGLVPGRADAPGDAEAASGPLAPGDGVGPGDRAGDVRVGLADGRAAVSPVGDGPTEADADGADGLAWGETPGDEVGAEGDAGAPD